MEISYTPLDLAAIDGLGADVLCCGLFEDERPMRGLGAVLDFRLAGRLSRLLADGELTGVAGEALLFPPRPRLSAERLVVFGWGRPEALSEERCAEAVGRLVRTLVGLGAKRAVVELIGRARGVCEPELAATLLFRAGEASGVDLSLVLVEDDAGRRRFAARYQDEKQRARRVL